MFLFTFIQECGPLSSRAYCIFVQPTNSNVLGTLAIRDVNNCDLKIAIGGFGKNTIHT